MPELKTDQALLNALEHAATRVPSRDQVEQQRISFILGSLPGESDITRQEVENVLRLQGAAALDT